MIKTTTAVLFAIVMLTAFGAFAGDHACCAKAPSKAAAMGCINLATLNLTADQKAQIEAWQAQCMKTGCTNEGRTTFLNRAKGILSAEQFAQLKAQCDRVAHAKKTET